MNNFTLITGACGGLGSAFAKECAKSNENLLLVGINETKLKALSEQLIKENGGIKVKYFICDQSKKETRTTFFNEIKKYAVTKAILNAGYIDEGAAETKTLEEQEGVIRVNCEGTVAIAKTLISKAVKSKEQFQLLVTSSLSAYYPMPQMAIYAASKAFLLHYFLALREEHKKDNITITVLCPGGIPTTAAMKDAIKVQGLGGKLTSASPEEVAKCGLKGLAKNKPVAIPGFVNKFLMWLGTRPSKTFTAKKIGKRWEKSRKKRTVLK